MRLLTPMAAFALLAALAMPALAQSDEAYILYRQKVMSSNGDNMAGIGEILKNKLPFSKNIAQHAQMVSINAKLIAVAFEKNIAAGKTDARADVWKDWNKFKDAADKLESESAKLAQVAAGGDMMAIGEQVKKVGGACKACHDDFRKPKEQSYKNM